MTTCGQCAYAKAVPKDLQQRVCHGVPPTPMLVPQNNGLPGVGSYRPNVHVQDMACGVYRPRHSMQNHMEAAQDALNSITKI